MNHPVTIDSIASAKAAAARERADVDAAIKWHEFGKLQLMQLTDTYSLETIQRWLDGIRAGVRY